MTITNSAIVRIGKYFQLREEAILVQDYFIKHHQWSKWQWYQYVLPNIGNHTKCWWFSSDLWSICSKFFVTIIFAWHHIRCADYQWYREFRVSVVGDRMKEWGERGQNWSNKLKLSAKQWEVHHNPSSHFSLYQYN